MRKFLIIVAAILGMIVGIAVGESLKGVSFLSFLAIGGSFGFPNPITIDLSFMQFTIGIWCKVSICGVLCMVIFALLAKQILSWLKI